MNLLQLYLATLKPKIVEFDEEFTNIMLCLVWLSCILRAASNQAILLSQNIVPG